MKITFKVDSQKDCSVVSLIKEINKISCRIYIDLENSFVAIENVNEHMIDNVIELVDNYYTILGVDIDNISEESVYKQDIPVIAETVGEHVASKAVETVDEKQPTVLEPQSEDDLIIKKIEFKNEYVENLINKFLKIAAWAMYKMNISEKEIGKFIYTSADEISMRYNKKECIKFSVGDIVDVNYGMHLPGEINGGHVSGIVCDILNKDKVLKTMVFVIPITVESHITSQSYIRFRTPEDVVYSNNYCFGATALLDKGRYIRAERFNSVIGKTTPEFFDEILHKLSSTFNFTNNFTNKNNTDEEVFETVTASEDNADKVVEKPIEIEEKKSPAKKIGGEETALLEAIGPSLDKLDKSKSVQEQVEGFMTEIGIPTTATLVAQSFVIACDIKRINYENVILELHKLNPNSNEDIIKSSLKEVFKIWLKQYPEVAKKCPKISLMAILKVFAKRFG